MYLGTPSSPDAQAAMSAGRLGCMTTPSQGNLIPEGAVYACDNGRFGKDWPGLERWWSWLGAKVERYGVDRCLFAVAPDVVGDAAATLEMAAPWLPRIRALGVPAAFVAQDGSDVDAHIPWGSFDVLFLGGSTEFKLGPAAHRLVIEARRRGLRTHMGRVNSYRRIRLAATWGVDSTDGTFLRFGPAIRLPEVHGWLDQLHAQPGLDLWAPEETA